MQLITDHDFDKNPMFLYLAFQAAHIPFTSTSQPSGIPSSYVDPTIYQFIMDKYVGQLHRQQYFMALSLVDQAVSDIYNTLLLKSNKIIDNTYIIFSPTIDPSCARLSPFLFKKKHPLFQPRKVGTYISHFINISATNYNNESNHCCKGWISGKFFNFFIRYCFYIVFVHYCWAV